ncbi:N-acetyltransferase family protein [Stella sp.]|uniref:GNAT family N-acetyltransferase n=1 Tax=Stella sp. TaxID=2912054 RepID=UPI0035AFBB9E
MQFDDYRIRKATAADIAAVREMQARSMRTLGGRFYGVDAVERFLAQVGTMDDRVVDEGHYFIAIDRAGRPVGSGGWSRQRPAYAGEGPAMLPTALATVRSVFVCPDHARRGVATRIMALAEEDAVLFGVEHMRLAATLSGIPLYEALGWRRVRPYAIRLTDGTRLDCLEMEKGLVRNDLAA